MSTEARVVRTESPAATRLFLLVVASAVFTSVLTGTMINVVIPVIRAEFGASAAQVGWVVTGFSLAYAVSVPLYGRVSDLFGVRRVFVFGVSGFAAGGLICALAPTLPLLILGRVVQAIGGAAIPALATVAVAKVLPPGNRGGAMGLVASSVGVGSAVGPVVGGVVGQFLGWRALFVGSVILALLLIPFALRALPSDESQKEDGQFDLLGGVLLGVGAGLFLFGITQGQVRNFTSFSSWSSFAGAVLATAGFVWRINAAPQPFVPPALFANRAYVAALVVGFFAMFANLVALVFVPLLIIEVNTLSPGVAGLVLTPGAVALALLSPLAGRLSDRIGVRPPIVTGLLMMAFSLLFLSTVAGASPLLIGVGVLGIGAGFALIQSPVNNAAAGALPDEMVGAGLGLFAGAFFLGSGAGPAFMGALLAARQEAGLAAWNPLYTSGAGDAAAFSDAFLVTALAALGALLAASGLHRVRKAG